MSDRKSKLIKKYMGEVKTKKKSLGREGLMIRDNQEMEINSGSSDSQQEQNIRERKRIVGSEDQQEVGPKVKIEEDGNKKSKTVSKGLRKALGLKKGEDIDEFMHELKVEGLDMKLVEQYLKNNKGGLTMDVKQQNMDKKKKERKRIRDSSDEEQVQSQGSDLVIPEQARTIYRDKQGRIKQFSNEQEKEMKKQVVMDRLAQWEKGMKNVDQPQEEDQKIDIWDDPMRRWAEPTKKNQLKCAYQGYANRFNIKPGCRWDGVVRGNGFETKCLQQINLKKLKESQQQRQYLKNL